MPELFPFQKNAIRWAQGKRAAIYALEQGLGKSVVGSVEIVPPGLIICTAAMKYRWEAELAVWRPDLRVQVLESKRRQKDGVASQVIEIDADADVWIVSYGLAGKAEVPAIHTLIADEVHKCKSMTAARTKTLIAWMKDAKKVRLLSGTPMPNRPIELFPMLTHTGALDGKGGRGTRMNYKEFGRRYCAGWDTPWGSFDVSGASNLDELFTLVSSHMLRLTKRQVAPEMPPKTYRVIPLEGGPTKEELDYLPFVKESLTLPEDPIAFEAISDIRKLHAQRKLPQAIGYIHDLLTEDESRKLVIFAHHRETVATLAAQLAPYGVVTLTGDTSDRDAYESVERFQLDGNVRVFIGNMQAAGEGITLTAANHVVFVEPSWTPAEIEQAADRCHRIGQSLPVTVDLLTVQGTIDATMLWAVKAKLEVISQVIKESKLMDYGKLANLFRAIADEFEGLTDDAPAPAEKKGARKAADKVAADTTKAATKAADKGETPSEEDLKAALVAAASKDKAAAKGVLAQFDATKLSEVEESDYAAVIAALGKVEAPDEDEE